VALTARRVRRRRPAPTWWATTPAAYREGRDVLHGVGLRLHQANGSPSSDPGRETTGRLLAASTHPTPVGHRDGVPAVELPLDLLRAEVAL
jgi:hypothetical protein